MEHQPKQQKRLSDDLTKTKPKVSSSLMNIKGMSRFELESLLHNFQAYQTEVEEFIQTFPQGELNENSPLSPFDQIFELSPLGYLKIDQNGEILEANHKASKLLMKTNSELLGQSISTFFSLELKLHFKQQNPLIKDFIITKTWRLEIKSPAGKSHHLELQGTSWNTQSSGKHQELLIIVIDKKISENHDLPHDLVFRELWLNSILNAAKEAIVTINHHGIMAYANHAVTALFGYELDDLLGCNINMLMPEPDKTNHDQYINHYIQTGQNKIIGSSREVVGIHKDGSKLPLELSITEFKIDNQPFFTGTLRDIRERKSKEASDKQHVEELAHVSRLGLMGEMASGISHEVNQPLAAITGYTQACLQIIQSDHPDLNSLSEILSKTHEQTIKAGKIIHRMRDFVKSHKMQRSSININELIIDALALFSDYKNYDIELKLDLPDDLPTLFADSVHIEQVFLNLVKNSIDAMTELPKKKKKRLVIQTRLTAPQKIEVRITDNGPGLTEDQRIHIFTPFFTTKKTGMGMGLSISRSIIEAHHGVLRFNSSRGNGTTFYFSLPTEG